MLAESDETSVAPALARLAAIDWDFANEPTGYLTHSMHPYPAKYIPQIPRALIRELSTEGETVADIFCGSGTTLVEAMTHGRHAIGIDANPLACLISEAKTTRLVNDDRDHLDAVVRRANELADIVSIQSESPLFRTEPFTSQAWRPLDDAISFWFEPFAIEELAETLSWCQELPTESCRKVALTAFSAIVVAVSRQDSDTRYVRRQKNLYPGDVLRRFARSLANATEAAVKFSEQVDSALSCKVYHSNVLTRPDIGTVDLVVCSPPYPNAYSYHLYHMTRMLWLGMDQPTFKREEIGSHRKYSNKGPNGATVATFRNEVATILDWLGEHLGEGRHACFVVGDSTIRGQRVSNADLIAEVATEHGFREADRITRRMQDTKKAFNPAIGKIKAEQVVLLQRECRDDR